MNLFAKKCVDDVAVVCLSKLPEISSFNRGRAFASSLRVLVGSNLSIPFDDPARCRLSVSRSYFDNKHAKGNRKRRHGEDVKLFWISFSSFTKRIRGLIGRPILCNAIYRRNLPKNAHPECYICEFFFFFCHFNLRRCGILFIIHFCSVTTARLIYFNIRRIHNRRIFRGWQKTETERSNRRKTRKSFHSPQITAEWVRKFNCTSFSFLRHAVEMEISF